MSRSYEISYMIVRVASRSGFEYGFGCFFGSDGLSLGDAIWVRSPSFMAGSEVFGRCVDSLACYALRASGAVVLLIHGSTALENARVEATKLSSNDEWRVLHMLLHCSEPFLKVRADSQDIYGQVCNSLEATHAAAACRNCSKTEFLQGPATSSTTSCQETQNTAEKELFVKYQAKGMKCINECGENLWESLGKTAFGREQIESHRHQAVSHLHNFGVGRNKHQCSRPAVWHNRSWESFPGGGVRMSIPAQ